jgi:ferrous iron transport protein B
MKAALVFTASYGVGVLAALGAAFVFRRTILPGGSKPLVIELPPYRVPGWRTALLHTFDRAKIFVKQAGSIILVISLVLWALAHYPKSAAPAAAMNLTAQAAQSEAAGDAKQAARLSAEAGRLTAQSSLQNSYAGKIGHQIGIGIVSSFAAREVIVSTLAIVYGVGEDGKDSDRTSLYDSLRRATRTDGTPIFNTATCASLLVFYILAAQCLSTTAVVRRETNSWKWPLFQIAYMTGLAYVAAFLVYQALRHFGHG